MLKTKYSNYLGHILVISNIGQTFSITTGLWKLLIALYDDCLIVVHTLHEQHSSYQLWTHSEPDFLLNQKYDTFKGKEKRKQWQSSQLFQTRKIYWNPSNWLIRLLLGGGGTITEPIQIVKIPQQLGVYSFLTWTLPLPSTPPPMYLLAKST